MSLLLLFQGVLAAADAGFDHSIGSDDLPINYLKLARTLAVSIVATTSPAWSPQPPQLFSVPPTGFEHAAARNERPPAHLIKPRAVSLLHEYSRAPIPFPAPPSGWDETPSSDYRAPAHRAPRRSVALLHEYSRAPIPFPSPPSGWDSTPNSDQRPPAHRIRTRSVDLLYEYSWQQSFDVPTGFDSSPSSDQRPPAHRIPPRSVALFGGISFVAQAAAAPTGGQTPSDYWFWRWEDPPRPAARSVQLRDQFAWNPNYFVEYQEGWRQQFSEPQRSPQRSIAMRDQFAWTPRPIEDSSVNGWWAPFPNPKALSPQPRLEGQISWTAQYFPEYREGWRSQFSEPQRSPARSIALRDQIAWAPQYFTEYQEGWRQEFSRPQRLSPQPRLEGQISWPGIGYSIVPAATPQEWWFERWPAPPKAAQRSVKLLGDDVIWPGLGYSFVIVSPTPSDLWFPRWQEPPKAPARAVDTLGNAIWAAQAPFVFQSGWGSSFPQPPFYARAPRSVETLGNAIWTAQPPFVFIQQGWQKFGEPQQRLTPLPRHQGFVAWAAQPPFVFQSGWGSAFSQPAAYAAQRARSVDLLSGWPWPGAGYSFVVTGAATPSTLWFTRWQDPPALSRPLPRLEGFVVWPGLGYSFVVPGGATPATWFMSQFPTPPLRKPFKWGVEYRPFGVKLPGGQTPSTLWFPRWQDPREYITKRYSRAHLGNWFMFSPVPPPVTIPWYVQWEDPPKLHVDVAFFTILDESGDNNVLDENGEPIVIEEYVYHIRVAVPGYIAWVPRFIAPPPIPTCGSVTIHFRPSASTGRSFRPRPSVKGQLTSRGTIRMTHLGCPPVDDEEET